MRKVKQMLCFVLGFVGAVWFLAGLVYAFADGLHRFDKDGDAQCGAQPGTCAYMSAEEAENTLPPTYYNEQ